MTLIVGALSTRGTWIVVSDRRLTADSQVKDDAANKAAIVTSPDYQFACTFTGLARFDRWDTATFLAHRLSAYVAHHLPLLLVIQFLVDDLRSAWLNGKWLAAAPFNDRLLVVGLFCHEVIKSKDVGARVAAICLSGQEVRLEKNDWVSPGDQLHLGAWQDLQPGKPAIREACVNNMMPEAVQVDLVVEHVRQAAERSEARVDQAVKKGSMKPGSRSTIGDEFTSISLSIDGASAFAVHSPRDTRGFSPTVIDPFGICEDMRAFSHVRPVWIAPPRFRRNHQCPCGRTAQYRHCHGRRNAPSPAVFHEEYSPKASYEDGRLRFARKQMFMQELTDFFAKTDAARFTQDN